MKAELEQRGAVASLIEAAAHALAAAGIESALLDAELLIAEAAGATRAQVASGAVALDARALRRCGEFVARRAAREPLAYIVGRKEFFSLDFEVTPAVLIPRPETETLVAAALEIVRARRECLVLDLGTGAGAIAVAIAANAPGARTIATDISEEALEVARRNAARLGCADRIEFRRGDCWEALAESAREGCFDLIVSNPPYIADDGISHLAPEISAYEPRIALAGGLDGLDFHRRIIRGVGTFLKARGELLVEIGAGQAAPVIELCRRAGCAQAVAIPDLSGTERVLRASFQRGEGRAGGVEWPR